jgi:chloramphenicol-sensitive protein RarD
MILLVYFMRLPIIALTLASTFALYAVLKKHLKMKALISLFYETLVFAVIAVGYLIYMESTGQGALHIAQPFQLGMLLGAGVITEVPLALFSMAANRLNLVTVGVMQYIAPSLSLMIGIFIFREPFGLYQFLAIVSIWVGLIVFTYGEILSNRRQIISQ